MSESFIPASEFETASNAVSNILGQPVEEIKITDILPPLNDIADSNKVFKGKLSVLFVDMRKSTDLTDELKSKKMVKVYRSFIRIVIQAIRYSGGYTRQFAGDGIMGIFQNSNVDDQNISSSCKAIKAARYIHTLIDFCLNPALKKSMDICIGCGVGICTGTIMITKVGMRGKESNKTAENETGIVWVGSTTNYANRYCSLAHPCEIFIDENTYSEIEDSEIWTKTSRTKGNKVFEGYAVSEHYLSLPEEITAEAVKADTENDSEASFIQNIFAETQEMLKICSLLIEDGTLRPFSIRWPKSAIISNTDCLIHASTAFRKTGNASTLSLIDILEPRVDEKYFLSPQATARLLYN